MVLVFILSAKLIFLCNFKKLVILCLCDYCNRCWKLCLRPHTNWSGRRFRHLHLCRIDYCYRHKKNLFYDCCRFLCPSLLIGYRYNLKKLNRCFLTHPSLLIHCKNMLSCLRLCFLTSPNLLIGYQYNLKKLSRCFLIRSN